MNKYSLNSNTFHITTESTDGINDKVDVYLYGENGTYITNIWWNFSDWVYAIFKCTSEDYSEKFPVTPPTGVKKTWDVTVTLEDVVIKCNAVEVLYFIFNDTFNNKCTSEVKGKKTTKIAFWNTDTATKMFATEQVGK